MEKKEIEKEFLVMIQQHEGIIYKVASFYTGSDASLSDLYQDVVLNLWKAFPEYRSESALSTWIYRIALNTCISYFRRNKNKPIHVEIPMDMPNIQDNNEEIRELYKLINQLNKFDRALVLLYLDEYPYKEIAEIMGLTTTNVSTKINRIKERLKQMSNN